MPQCTAIFYLTFPRRATILPRRGRDFRYTCQKEAQMYFDHQAHAIRGDHGSLPVGQEDEVARKLAMLIEGQCEGLGPIQAAEKHGFTKQRYFQLLHAYEEKGAHALANKTRGPKHNYRRTDELVRQVIRHRFLDPEASADVIAQKLRQTGLLISTRSVERVIADYGLQKKTLQLPPAS
jgi:transposase